MLCRVKDSTEVGVKIPQKTEITLSVPLSESQHSWYMKTLTGCDEMLGKSGAGSQEHSASVVGPGNQPTIRQAKHSPKAVQNMLMELRKVSNILLTRSDILTV